MDIETNPKIIEQKETYNEWRENAEVFLKEKINAFLWENANPNLTLVDADNLACRIYDLLMG